MVPSQSLSMPSLPTASPEAALVSNAHGLTSESWSLQSPAQVVQPSPSSSRQALPSPLLKPSKSKLASVALSAEVDPSSPGLESKPGPVSFLLPESLDCVASPPLPSPPPSTKELSSPLLDEQAHVAITIDVRTI